MTDNFDEMASDIKDIKVALLGDMATGTPGLIARVKIVEGENRDRKENNKWFLIF